MAKSNTNSLQTSRHNSGVIWYVYYMTMLISHIRYATSPTAITWMCPYSHHLSTSKYCNEHNYFGYEQNRQKSTPRIDSYHPIMTNGLDDSMKHSEPIRWLHIAHWFVHLTKHCLTMPRTRVTRSRILVKFSFWTRIFLNYAPSSAIITYAQKTAYRRVRP